MGNWIINKVSPKISQAYERMKLIRRPVMAKTLAKIPYEARPKALETLAAQGIVKWGAFNESRTKAFLEPKNLDASHFMDTVTPDDLNTIFTELYLRYKLVPSALPLNKKEDTIKVFLSSFCSLPFTNEEDLRQAFQLLVSRNIISQGNLKDKILKGKFELKEHMIAGSATPGNYAVAVREIATKDTAAAQALASQQTVIFQGTVMPRLAKAAVTLAYGLAAASPALAFLHSAGIGFSSVLAAFGAGVIGAKLYGYKQKPGTYLPLSKNRFPRFNPRSRLGKIIDFLRKNIFFVPFFSATVILIGALTYNFVKRRFYPPVISPDFYARTTVVNEGGRVFVNACHPDCWRTELMDFGNRLTLAREFTLNLQAAIDNGDIHDRGVTSRGDDGVYIINNSLVAEIPSAIRPDWNIFLTPLVTDLRPGEASELNRMFYAAINPTYVEKARGIDRREMAQRRIYILGRPVLIPKFRDPGLESHLIRARALIALGRYHEAREELHAIQSFQLSVTTRRALFTPEAYSLEAEIFMAESLLHNDPSSLQGGMAVTMASLARLGRMERGYVVAGAAAQIKICEYAALVFPYCLQSSVEGETTTNTCPPAGQFNVTGLASPLNVSSLMQLCSPEAVNGYVQQVLSPYFPLYVDNFLAMRAYLSHADYDISIRDFTGAEENLTQARTMISIINNRPLPWADVAPHATLADRAMLHLGGESWGAGSFRFRDNLLRIARYASPTSISNFFASDGRTLNPQIDPQMFLYFEARIDLSSAYIHQSRAATAAPDEQLQELEAARSDINKALEKFERIRARDERNFWAGLDEERNFYLEALVRSAEIDFDLFRYGGATDIDFARLMRRAQVAIEHLINPPQAPNPTLLRAQVALAKGHIFQHDNVNASPYLRMIIAATEPRAGLTLSPIFLSTRTEAQGWQTFIRERPGEPGIPSLPQQLAVPHPPIVPFAIYPAISGGM